MTVFAKDFSEFYCEISFAILFERVVSYPFEEESETRGIY